MSTYNRKDSYYKKAKAAGYRSRAAYKLLELTKREKLFAKQMKVLDLGCAPGGWLQVAAKLVGPKGLVVGIDRLEVQALDLANVKVIQGDITDSNTRESLTKALGGKAGLVLSDMAPDTSGVGFADHHQSVQLVRMAVQIGAQTLVPGGKFCAKVFEGAELNELISEIKKDFKKVRRVKPKATRKGSRELYLICTGFGLAQPNLPHY